MIPKHFEGGKVPLRHRVVFERRPKGRHRDIMDVAAFMVFSKPKVFTSIPDAMSCMMESSELFARWRKAMDRYKRAMMKQDQDTDTGE